MRYNGRPFLPNACACTSRSFSIVFVVVVNRDYLLDNARVRFLFKSWVVKDTERVRAQTGSSLVWSNYVFSQALLNFNGKWKPPFQDLFRVDKSQIRSCEGQPSALLSLQSANWTLIDLLGYQIFVLCVELVELVQIVFTKIFTAKYQFLWR